MPTYDFFCTTCNALRPDVIRSLAEHGTPCPCPECGNTMRQLLSAPMLVMDYPGYTCPITGDWIEGRRAHRENLKKHGCRVLEAGEKEQMLKNKAEAEKTLDESLEQTVGAAVEAMTPRDQERLYQELSHTDLAVQRKEGPTV